MGEQIGQTSNTGKHIWPARFVLAVGLLSLLAMLWLRSATSSTPIPYKLGGLIAEAENLAIFGSAFVFVFAVLARSRLTARLGLLFQTGALVLLWLFVTSHSGAVPIREVLSHCDRVEVYDLKGNGQIAVLTKPDIKAVLLTGTFMSALKPAHAPDLQFGIDLQHDASYQQAYFGAPTTMRAYSCFYYSREGVISDPKTDEYVHAPETFRTWIANATRHVAATP